MLFFLVILSLHLTILLLQNKKDDWDFLSKLQVYISQFWLSRNSFFWPRNKKNKKVNCDFSCNCKHFSHNFDFSSRNCKFMSKFFLKILSSYLAILFFLHHEIKIKDYFKILTLFSQLRVYISQHILQSLVISQIIFSELWIYISYICVYIQKKNSELWSINKTYEKKI